MSIGASATTYSVQTGYTFYYDTFVSTSQTIKVVAYADTSAILYSIQEIPKTFNNFTINNVIKVITNFTTATNITGTSIFNGSACTTTCYLTYTSMTTLVTISTPNVTTPHTYNLHLEGLLTVAVLNPLFTLQQ